MKKRVLGLDIGNASIGWAIVDLDEEQKELDDKAKESKYKVNSGEIIAAGVRTFQQPIDRQKKSLAKIRGEARRLRATLERRAERLEYFVKYAKEYKLIDENFSTKELDCPKTISLKDWNDGEQSPWALRAKALDEKLSGFELFRALYHIAKHRGFYFPTKAERIEDDKDSDNETKLVKSALKKNKDALRESGARTIGEYLYKKEKKNNKGGVYTNSIPREELKAEVNAIFEAQRSFNNPLVSKDLEEKYIAETLFYTHKIDDAKIQKMMGRCEFVEGEMCFPKNGYESELFSFYNRLNSLKLKKEGENKLIDLDSKQREKIKDLVFSKDKVSFSDLRVNLFLDDSFRFNLCDYREFNPEYNKSITIKKEKTTEVKKDTFDLYERKKGEVLDNCYDSFMEYVNNYFEKYSKAKELKISYHNIRNKCNIPNEQKFAILSSNYFKPIEVEGAKKYLAQFESNTFVELKGYSGIKKLFGSDFDKVNNPDCLNTIAEALVYYQDDEKRKDYLIKKGITDNDIIEKILEHNMKDLSSFSLIALKKINNIMKDGTLFNEAKEKAGFVKKEYKQSTQLDEYHGFFEKNAVVARVLGQFRKVMNAISREYCQETPIDEIHIEVATDVANSNRKQQNIRTGQAQFKEQKNAAKELCLSYGINPDEADNLLRFRLTMEQDCKCIYSGKPICLDPKDKTPAGHVSIFECEIDHIIPMSRSFNDSLQNKVICCASENQDKKARIPFEYFRDNKSQEEWKKFEARVKSSNKLRGAKKQNLLREKFDDEDKNKFLSRDLNNTRYATRHIAEHLRNNYDFSKSQIEMPIQNRVRVFGGGITAKMRHFWGLNKDRDENDKHHAMDAMVVSCTSFSNIFYICSRLKDLEEKGIKPKKASFEPWEGANIRETILSKLDDVFVSRMVRQSATGSLHKDGIDAANSNAKSGFKVRGGIAANGEMLRTDVFSKKNKKGKEEFYLVPVYLHQMGGELPNKAIAKSKAENEWIEIDDSFEFKFSLYKDSLVKVKKGEDIKFGYFNGTDRSSNSISLKQHDGSYNFSGVGVKSLDRFKKYQIDVLGKYVEVKKEKRLPINNIKSNSQKYKEKQEKKIKKKVD